MLDKWQDDVVSALQYLRHSEGLSLQPSDCLTANDVMMALMRSYVWKGEFDGAKLHVRLDNSGYSWISLPDYFDPLADETDPCCRIRPPMDIKTMCNFYEYPDYGFDDEGADFEPWATDDESMVQIFSQPIHTLDSAKVKQRLCATNQYYAMLLDENPANQALNIENLKDIRYQILEKGEGADFESMTKMGYMGHTKQVFGHRYFSYNDSNRIYIAATNALGPVGIMCLFDYGAKEGEGRNPDKLSISFVSVSPGYRQLGIASQMLRTAAEFAQKTQRYITRTEPSSIGKRTSCDAYTNLMKKEFPKIPFIGHMDADYLHQIERISGFSALSYQAKCAIIKDSVSAIGRMFQEPEKRRRYADIDMSKIVEQATSRVARFTALSKDRAFENKTELSAR